MNTLLSQQAHVFEMTLFHVTTNTDLNEGRGSEKTVGWFVDEDIARRASRRNYVQGTDCPVVRKSCTVVRTEDGKLHLLGEPIEVEYEDPREVRARALQKLSSKERKALGIKD